MFFEKKRWKFYMYPRLWRRVGGEENVVK